MVFLRINNVDLPVNWTHDATDWQISTKIDFSEILAESLNDTVNLTTRIFNNELELGTKYYARARMVFNNMFTEWCNIDVFTPEDVDETTLNLDIPSIITTPTLYTEYEVNSNPSSNFLIKSKELFSTSGNATHESTTWLIEDIYGKPLLHITDDKDNLTELLVEHILPVNNFYKLSASFKGSNGDISQFGSTVIYISNNDIIDYSRVSIVKTNVDHEVILNNLDGLDILEWKLYKDDTVIDSGDTIEDFFTIAGTNFINGVRYNLGIKIELNSKEYEWSYFYLICLDNLEERSGNNTPYKEPSSDIYLDSVFPYQITE